MRRRALLQSRGRRGAIGRRRGRQGGLLESPGTFRSCRIRSGPLEWAWLNYEGYDGERAATLLTHSSQQKARIGAAIALPLKPRDNFNGAPGPSARGLCPI